jgi:hypothetical protein
MAEYGEWVRKGAVLSEKTAAKEYGVDREFIIDGIRAGKLEYRHGVMWGNPYLRILRSQLETYIAARNGPHFLAVTKRQTELKAIDRELAELKARIAGLESRKAELERMLGAEKKPRRARK